MNLFTGKKILVVGGTGSIGERLVRELLACNPHVLRIYSRDEYKQFELRETLDEHKNVRYLLGDVRDRDRLYRSMNGIDIVFDLAALKHVPACEYNPFEAVETNVVGTQNVIEAAIENRVERVIYASSDKAVSPTNTMGATKLLAERLISAADFHKGGGRPVFCAVRFGNVIGSRGSVIPLFIRQIRERRMIRVTDPDMTRFMMSIGQAVQLMMIAAGRAQGGEVFVLKMPALRLGDLVEVVRDMACVRYGYDPDTITVHQVGLRAGEKMYEELLSDHELIQTRELDDMFVIYPLHRIAGTLPIVESNAFVSSLAPKLPANEIRRLLRDEAVIE